MDGQDGRDKNEKQEACSLFRVIAMNPSIIRLYDITFANPIPQLQELS